MLKNFSRKGVDSQYVAKYTGFLKEYIEKRYFLSKKEKENSESLYTIRFSEF